MMMNLIAELSTGGKTPDGCKIGTPQKVIYQCSEDGVSDTIKPRLERCGADCGKIAFINEEVYNGLTLDDERIRQAIIELKTRLYITPKRLQKRKTGICMTFTAMKENPAHRCGNVMRLNA